MHKNKKNFHCKNKLKTFFVGGIIKIRQSFLLLCNKNNFEGRVAKKQPASVLVYRRI